MATSPLRLGGEVCGKEATGHLPAATARRQEAIATSLPGDRNRKNVILLPIDRLDHGSGRTYRYVVFA